MTLHPEIPPVPPFKIGKWLLGVMTTAAIAGGIFGALAITLIPEGVFNFGPDTTIRGRGLKSVDERVVRLEQKIASVQPSSGTDVRALQANVANAVNETRELKQQVAAIQTGDHQESRMASIVVGLTQLKTAYDNDQPMTDGIASLGKAFPEGPVMETLNALAEIIGKQEFTSKEVLLTELQKLRQTPNTPTPAPLSDKDMTWQERAKLAIGQFVKVQPTQAIEQSDTLGQIEQAVSLDQFANATHLLASLPQTVEIKTLQAQIATRGEAHDLVQKATLQVSRALGQSTGSLY